MIEYTKFNYSPLGKALRKQIKSVKHQGRKPVEARKILKPAEQKKTKSIKYIFPKNQQSNNIKKELNQIKKQEIKLIEIIWFTKKYICI